MKTRFRKVWCSSCSTMQFAGECPHPQQRPRIAWPAGVPPMALTIMDAAMFGVTQADMFGAELRRHRERLILPPLVHWTEYKVDGRKLVALPGLEPLGPAK
jgi:hypothetical protein